ncbi:serine/threonine-protein kinase [Nocardia sp. NPDC059091]|uniref:serine/threonine-protein kinase n=1 Tax=unclassified Nocardia TaxID=2637762 RepID=UPI0036CEB070
MVHEPFEDLIIDPAERSRTALAGAAARFEQAWAVSGCPPDLSAYLPDADAERRAVLVELIKIDLENRWVRHHFPKRLAEYCEQYAELRSGPPPADLVYEEYHALRRGSQPVAGEESTQPGAAAEPAATEIGRPPAQLDTTEYRSTMVARPSAQVALGAINPGDRVGDFDLLTMIGEGAFARVYLARQRSMQRLVAVKISHNHGTEPETLAQLDHEYIVRIFDQRLIADGELKLLYMQYLPGGTLLDVLNRLRSTPVEARSGQVLLDTVDGVLEDKGEVRAADTAVRARIAAMTWPETVAWLGRRLADALGHAAGRGVLHRDIKPANVLLSADGIPKLADFNVSFSQHIRGTSPLAYFGGSLAYMSPEQLEACHPELPGTAADLDTRSDIYALAVMLWALLTGRIPFADEEFAGMSETSLGRMLELRRRPIDPRYLSEVPSDCPAALRQVLLTCLSPDREDRYSSGSELALQLDLCLDERARDLVYPPENSWRARLSPHYVPILWLIALVADGLAAGYLYGQTVQFGSVLLPGGPTRSELLRLTNIFHLIAWPLALVSWFYLCRHLIAVPRGLRKGRRYDEALLARVRSFTLFWADFDVMFTLVFWTIGAGVFVALLDTVVRLPPRLLVHSAEFVLVCAAFAVSYTFFVQAFYIVRCVYPIYLRHGHTTARDAAHLRALRRRSTVYLGIAASVPLVAVVTGLSFLGQDERARIMDSVLWLCVITGLAFVAIYWLFRKLEADLRALERVVEKRSGIEDA